MLKKQCGAVALLLVLCLCLSPLCASAEGLEDEGVEDDPDPAPIEELESASGGVLFAEPENLEECFAEADALNVSETALSPALIADDEEELVEEAVEAIPLTVSESGADNDALFRAYFEKLLFPQEKLRRPVGEANLTGVDKKVYSILAEKIADVAQNGGFTAFSLPITEIDTKLTWTREELGGITIVSGGAITVEAKAAVSRLLDLGSLSLEVSALEQDFPFDMYWFDKTAGVTRNVNYGLSASSKSISITSGTVSYSFSVANGYGANNYVYESEVSRAQTAARNARSIVERYALCGDREKLAAYKNEICARTSYNSAAAGGGAPYGDPWQAIYVFDGDEETTVVCEGYAKAFEYLCDMSTFASPQLSCVSVTGTMSGGGHMWNIVTLDDGENYLADLTNCDTGSLGADDRLFLIGYYSGSASEGYRFLCRGTSIHYVYDGSTTRLMTEEELTLTPARFEDTPTWTWGEDHSSAEMSICYLGRPSLVETVKASVTSETTPASCTENGLTVYTATAQLAGKTFTDEKSVVLPMTGHDPVFQSADWDVNEDEVFGAFFMYKCSVCENESEEFVLPDSCSDSRGWRTYTATDAQGNTATSEPIQQFYTVVFNGKPQSTMYAWGEVCLLTSADEEVKAWYLVNDGVETLLADGVSSCCFAVTDNTEIVTNETENHEPQAAVAVTLKSESAGTAVFNAMWSIPEGARVKSAVIYRGYTSADKDVPVGTMVSKGAPFDTRLLVRNGSYRLNISGLDATKYQHVMIRVTYTVDGEDEINLDSAVLRILPNGGQAAGT